MRQYSVVPRRAAARLGGLLSGGLMAAAARAAGGRTTGSVAPLLSGCCALLHPAAACKAATHSRGSLQRAASGDARCAAAAARVDRLHWQAGAGRPSSIPQRCATCPSPHPQRGRRGMGAERAAKKHRANPAAPEAPEEVEDAAARRCVRLQVAARAQGAACSRERALPTLACSRRAHCAPAARQMCTRLPRAHAMSRLARPSPSLPPPPPPAAPRPAGSASRPSGAACRRGRRARSWCSW